MQSDIWVEDPFESSSEALNALYQLSTQTLALVQLLCVGVYVWEMEREREKKSLDYNKKEDIRGLRGKSLLLW